mgnify:CR=1 FL=1
MDVKNIIAEDMPFTKSIFEQFWRSYCKKTIFVVFHFLKFLPIYKTNSETVTLSIQERWCTFVRVCHCLIDAKPKGITDAY